ncbi:hypothetical protein TSUD_217080 [Trifolium subterraneum]|uniref:VQ domain-containing protein n=1 Tax=Trifolium subterraneum TaxID=3900 RepID=A0A2Z6MPQ8_TRISU|nr:hypothetical protein TSUD_217080 [Trifolium subterraneum]
MDSGNSGSISSSGDEEYDSRNHHQTLLPSNFFNQQPTLQFNPQSSLQSFNPAGSSNVSLFDLSPTYLQNLSQSQPNITFPISQGVSSSSQQINQCLLATPNQDLGVFHDDNNNARVTLSSPQLPSSSTAATTNNASRNSKKRTRASRRAPTTVLTTDTSNFRAMVQEFTGIPAPPFSGSSYSRRLDLLTSSSSLRSSNSSQFDNTTSPFYPLRPSPQKLHHHNHPNPLLLSSSSSSSHNMVDANSNYHQHLPISDLGLPYNNHNHHQQHNFMLSMQNQQPIHAFNPSSSSQQFHPFSIGGNFGAKSQSQHGNLSVNSLEDLGVNQGHLGHHDDDDGGGSRRDVLRCLDHENSYGGKVVGSSSSGGGGVGSNCKVNFSGSVATTLNHDKTMENNNNNDNDNSNNNNNNNNNNNRGEGAGGGGVDSWICSSDRNIL